MKASDIPDIDVLERVQACQEGRCEAVLHDLFFRAPHWSMTAVVQEALPEFPPKVVAAKLSRLLRRGLLTGCDCGCRGDWELTDKGREVILEAHAVET